MKKLRALREFWEDKDSDIRTGNRKLLLLSLTEIFKDVLPDYTIRYVKLCVWIKTVCSDASVYYVIIR